MKTVVAMFESFADARQAVDDLEESGFTRTAISLVTQHDELAERPHQESETGAVVGAGLGILTGLASVTIPGIGLVAAIGPIVAGGVVGAVAGGLIGSLIEAGVSQEDASAYVEGVRQGESLVAATLRDEDVARGVEILKLHNPLKVDDRAAAPAITPAREIDVEEEADLSRFDPEFRDDFGRAYRGTEYTFEECKPAYRFGAELACQCGGGSWDSVENNARRDWERCRPGTWDRLKHAAHFGYDRACGGSLGQGSFSHENDHRSVRQHSSGLRRHR